MSGWTLTLMLVAAGVALWAATANWLLAQATRNEDVLSGLVRVGIWLYARLFHRLRVEGADRLPKNRNEAGPIIVVSNHTAGVDPILIQSVCRFETRWIMAQDMRVAVLEPFWRWLRIVFIERDGGSAIAMRAALRELERGGQVGVFPEGRIERNRGELGVFHAGVGVLVARSHAPVLPFVIEGTPEVDTAWGSLWRRGKVRIRVMPLQTDLAISVGRDPQRITAELRRRYAAWTGWSMCDAPGTAPAGASVERRLPKAV